VTWAGMIGDAATEGIPLARSCAKKSGTAESFRLPRSRANRSVGQSPRGFRSSTPRVSQGPLTSRWKQRSACPAGQA